MTARDDIPPGSGRLYSLDALMGESRFHEPENVRINLSCLNWVDAEKMLPRKSKKASRQKKKSYYHN